MPTAVYVETAERKVFACALDWPGWARSARDEDAALGALAAYAPRYRVVAEAAGARFPGTADRVDVVEHLAGGGSTAFGIPEQTAQADARPLTAAAARKQVALLQASWRALDELARTTPAQLRKGPRGGGRDRDKVVEHVHDAERAHLAMIGRRPRDVEDVRAAVVDILSHGSDGSPLGGPKSWRPRCALRRFTWHVLDHVWEIEDRSTPAAPR